MTRIQLLPQTRRTARGACFVLRTIFCLVTFNLILIPNFAFSYIPPQSGKNLNRLGRFNAAGSSFEVSLKYTVSGRDYTIKTKRKKKHKKRSKRQSDSDATDTSTRRRMPETQNDHEIEDINHRDHQAYLKMLDRHPALVLNADYQPLSSLPLSLWSWQETVKSVFSGKVVVVDVYPNTTVRAVNMNMALPSVIALTDYVPQPPSVPAFTRKNVFLRDGYKCQYCGMDYSTNELSFDHVVPRCKGGKLEWENVVTCCKKCNGRKGSCLPSDLRSVGMKLLRTPRTPTQYELAAVARTMAPRRVHPTWAPYVNNNLNTRRK